MGGWIAVVGVVVAVAMSRQFACGVRDFYAVAADFVHHMEWRPSVETVVNIL